MNFRVVLNVNKLIGWVKWRCVILQSDCVVFVSNQLDLYAAVSWFVASFLTICMKRSWLGNFVSACIPFCCEYANSDEVEQS